MPFKNLVLKNINVKSAVILVNLKKVRLPTLRILISVMENRILIRCFKASLQTLCDVNY